MKVKVRLFGAFRKYGDGAELELELPQDATLTELRKAFNDTLKSIDPSFSNAALIEDSAFADETSVLTDSARLIEGGTLAVLPPVCGG